MTAIRVLYLVHGHPLLSVGGAEHAAFSLFHQALRHTPIEPWILAAVPTSKGLLRHGELRNVEGTDREYLIGTNCDWFRFTNDDIASLRRGLSRLLQHVQPQIIHLQHYVHFGIDVIPLLQSLCPSARIVATLHEYLALCHHNGQMVTTGEKRLCEQATPIACASCYPEHSITSFFLRHHFIKTILQSCDALISPSYFLIERYRQCGIDHPHFAMVENGLQADLKPAEQGDMSQMYSTKLNRFAFFGRLNPYKGILLLLKAIYHLKKRGHGKLQLNIYGIGLRQESRLFQEKFKRHLHKVADLVVLRGSYKQAEVPSLMAENDWTVVPSIWWENSPVVIQESLANRRPVIGSNIGGILEKIDNRGGILFQANSETSLANALKRCMGNSTLHQQLVAQIQKPFMAADCWAEHLQLYCQLLSDGTP